MDCGPTTAQRMQLYERCAAALACEASQSALENAAIPADRVTHLVTISCTGFAAPGVDLQIIEQLGLSAEVARTHVGFMGCHGAMNGLRVARAFAESDPQACVLLCAVELCSLHQQYGWHPERIVANALFADGSAAVVGKGCPAEAPLPWRLVSSGSTILPHSADLMSWRIGDHGFEMTLSPRVPEVIRRELCDWLQQWLSQAGLQIGNICSWVIHPGGPRILKACAETLGLSDAQLRPSQKVLAEFGNMSSPTVLFILERLMQADASRPCVMLAFGPGLTIEAALLL
ncbi:MAG: type III polyketide synthase [Planctomycetes bacterium]|nr:type III polyketide synthase [Planctomycetota bacterium]